MSMEIAQLCISTYKPSVAAIRISLSQEKHVSNMVGERTLAEPKLKITP